MSKNIQRYYTPKHLIRNLIYPTVVVSKFITEKRESVQVLRACADLYSKQVFYCTNIVVHLYCYLDSIRCSWIIRTFYNSN